jgi:hypothetical protein
MERRCKRKERRRSRRKKKQKKTRVTSAVRGRWMPGVVPGHSYFSAGPGEDETWVDGKDGRETSEKKGIMEHNTPLGVSGS